MLSTAMGLISQVSEGFSYVLSDSLVAKHGTGTGQVIAAEQHSAENSEDAVLKAVLKES